MPPVDHLCVGSERTLEPTRSCRNVGADNDAPRHRRFPSAGAGAAKTRIGFTPRRRAPRREAARERTTCSLVSVKSGSRRSRRDASHETENPVTAVADVDRARIAATDVEGAAVLGADVGDAHLSRADVGDTQLQGADVCDAVVDVAMLSRPVLPEPPRSRWPRRCFRHRGDRGRGGRGGFWRCPGCRLRR